VLRAMLRSLFMDDQSCAAELSRWPSCQAGHVDKPSDFLL
jgi:hypothetical protein